MKYHTAYTKNVAQASSLFNALLQRSPVVPGFGLIDGRPGLGKTFATIKLLNSIENGIYIRAVALDSAASFLDRLLKELSVRDRPRAKMARYEKVIDALHDQPRVLFIDEADYYMDKPQLLETLRDIHDMTGIAIILVGMDKIARKISLLPQLDSRISQRYEFQPADLEDMQIMVKELFEHGITVSDSLLRKVINETNGNYRLSAIALENIERKAKVDGIKHIDVAEYGIDQPVL
ncbi:MAG: AAA family ATPase [Alteromonadaceae bacterium]|nr:AAA family ATPase [Alteromonadaceae bacterium]